MKKAGAIISAVAGIIVPVLFCAAEETPDIVSFLEQEYKVYTASRKLELAKNSPVAVDVITAEEIKASGAGTLADLLRFKVGMDVIDGRSADGNRAEVSVRGFSSEFVTKLLVLVDGRRVYTETSGGVYWEQIPAQLQDIERLEIVRGPNAALYGSNAALGVVNIITKKPGNEGISLNTRAGGRGAASYGASAENSFKNFSFRLSHTYQEDEGYVTASGDKANDFRLSNKSNLRGLWTPGENTAVEIFAGRSWDKTGISEAGDPSSKIQRDFQMARLSRKLGENSSLEITTSRNDLEWTKTPNASGGYLAREYQYETEALHRFGWLDGRMETIWGAGYRHVGVESARLFAGKGVISRSIWRGFLRQSARPFEKLILIAAGSVDEPNNKDAQPAYQASALFSASDNHTFRLTHAMSPNLNSVVRENYNFRYLPYVQVNGDAQLATERLYSYEAAYTGAFLDRKLTAEADFFYMDIRNINERVVQSTVFTGIPPFFFLQTMTYANVDRAAARGAELKLNYKFGRKSSFYANYTREHVTDQSGREFVIKTTPAHKANLGGMIALGRGFTLGVNAGYKDGYVAVSDSRFVSRVIPAYWRLDARLAYSPKRNMEIFVSGHNLATPRHKEFMDTLEIPRTVYGGMSVNF